MLLGKIVFLGGDLCILEEERTEGNKARSDEELSFRFEVHNVAVLNNATLEEGDIVWFSLVKPCGGKETVDTIKKPVFPGK